MKTTSDEELTKLAVESLLRDARKFTRKREMEFQATQQRQANNLNKSFLRNLLTNNDSHNRRVNEKKHTDYTKFKGRWKGGKNGTVTDSKDVINSSDSVSIDEFKVGNLKKKKIGNNKKEKSDWKFDMYEIEISSDSTI